MEFTSNFLVLVRVCLVFHPSEDGMRKINIVTAEYSCELDKGSQFLWPL